MCLEFLYDLCLEHFSISEEFSNIQASTTADILVKFLCNVNFLDRFKKKKDPLKYQILWKSVQLELSCSMRIDRHDEANCRFSKLLEPLNRNYVSLHGVSV